MNSTSVTVVLDPSWMGTTNNFIPTYHEKEDHYDKYWKYPDRAKRRELFASEQQKQKALARKIAQKSTKISYQRRHEYLLHA